jgi:hypothetical protein
MVIALAKDPSGRLLKHVVRCYLRLSDNQRYLNQYLWFFLTFKNHNFFPELARLCVNVYLISSKMTHLLTASRTTNPQSTG